jgi:hypothetical protein
MTFHFTNSVYARCTECFEERDMAKIRIVLEAEEKRELNKRLRARPPT